MKSYTLKSVLVHVYLYSFLSRPKSTLSYFASITIVSDLGFTSKVIITTNFKHFYLIRLLGEYNTVPPPQEKTKQIKHCVVFNLIFFYLFNRLIYPLFAIPCPIEIISLISRGRQLPVKNVCYHLGTQPFGYHGDTHSNHIGLEFCFLHSSV